MCEYHAREGQTPQQKPCGSAFRDLLRETRLQPLSDEVRRMQMARSRACHRTNGAHEPARIRAQAAGVSASTQRARESRARQKNTEPTLAEQIKAYARRYALRHPDQYLKNSAEQNGGNR